MITHDATLRCLDDYADNELDAAARAEIDRHIADCSDCRAALQKRVTRRAKVGALRQKLEPGRDLWPAIAPRLDAVRGRARSGHRVVQSKGIRAVLAGVLAAAAMALIARSRGPTLATVPGVAPNVIPSTAVAASAPRRTHALAGTPPEGALLGEADYLRAIGALMSEFAESRPSMMPETAAVFDENLRIIDGAIDAWRGALLTTPDDPEVRASLDQAYEDKLELLRSATELPTRI